MKGRFLFLINLSSGIFILAFLASGAWAERQDRGQGFLKHGVAVGVSRTTGGAIVEDGKGRPKLLIFIVNHGDVSSGLAMIDPDTGETTFFDTPPEIKGGAFAFLYSRKGCYYMLFSHHFVEFDPRKGEYTFLTKAFDRTAMWLTEADDGVIWAGTFPNAHLVSFDPEMRKYTDHGAVNEENWNQYPRRIATDSAGWVYAHIGFTRNHIVALNPETGEIRPMVKEKDRVGSSDIRGNLWRGEDGNVYGRMPLGGPWLRMHGGEVKETLKEEPDVAPVLERSGSQGAVLGELPDGRRVRVNMSERTILVFDKGETTQVSFDYFSKGARIHSLTLGPDGLIYGGTSHPGYFFSYDPKTGSISLRAAGGGSINAMTTQADKLYGAKYTQGILVEYDPATDQELTYRELARGGEILLRPHTILALSNGRHVIQTGAPGYGRTGGGMMVYDVKTEEAVLYDHTKLIENHSTMALAELPDGNLIGGTTIRGGIGGEAIAEEFELYIMEWPSLNVVYREAIFPGSPGIRDLIVAEDGLVYGWALQAGPDAGTIFFVFDPTTRKVLHSELIGAEYGGSAGGQAPRVKIGSDGNIYALYGRSIAQIEPGTFKHRKLADTPVDVNVGTALLDGRLYFSSGSELWSYAIPGLSEGE